VPDEGEVRFSRGRWERYHNGRWVPIGDPAELRQAAAHGVAAARRAAKAATFAKQPARPAIGGFAAKKPAAKKPAAKKAAAKKAAAKKAR
jgi:hypothetical protein